jgi:hypothetical protein
MKKYFLLIVPMLIALASFGQVQLGNQFELKGKDNSGVIGVIMRSGGMLKVRDSAFTAQIAAGINASIINWPSIQAVSGTVAVSNFPSSFSVSNFPATQAVTQSGTWNVGVTGSVAVTGTFWQATQPVSGTFWQATQPVSLTALPAFSAIPTFKIDQTTPGTTNKVDIGSNGSVTITGTVPLPTSAATSTKQSDGSQKTQLVDGSGNVVGATANALDVNIKSGGASGTQYAEGATAATGTGTLAMAKSGTTMKANQADASGNLRVDLSQTSANATAIKVDNSAVTQPVSGTVTANAGTNLNTSALALESGGNLAAIKIDVDKIPAQGQALSAASMPVVLPAAQISALTPPTTVTVQQSTAANLKVDLSGTAANATAIKVDASATTQPVSGTVTANAGTNLNTSALALESGGNLASINTKLPAQGQALAAASVPVVLTAIQQTALTPPAAITNYANETGGNLASIKTDVDKLPSLGQQTMANSQPVVLSSDFVSTKITGQSAQTATVNNILTTSSGTAAIDVSNFKSFTVQMVSTGTGGTYAFEGSNDNVNFQAVYVWPESNSPTLQSTFTASASQFLFHGACSYTYLRVRIVTTITGGSLQAFTSLFSAPISTTIMPVGNGSTGLSIGTLNTISQLMASAADADGTANPTTTGIRSFDLLFNGTTHDRRHGNWNTTTGDNGAKVAAGNGATQTNYDSRGAEITVLFSATSGTFTTMQFQLQYSFDAGTTWKNFGPATTNNTTPSSTDTYTFMVYPTNISQAAGTSPVDFTTSSTQTVRMNTVLPRTWRITWNIAGTSPSVTITQVYVNYQMYMPLWMLFFTVVPVKKGRVRKLYPKKLTRAA